MEVAMVDKPRAQRASGALWQQLAHLWPALAGTGAAIILSIAFAYALSRYQNVPAWFLSADPTALNDARWWLGLLSNLGIMLWAAATAMCALGAYLLHRTTAGRGERAFLLASTAACLALALDDAFLLHEDVLPAHLGIPEKATYGLYAAAAVAYAVAFWRMLRRTDYMVLLIAMACYAASIAIDLLTYETFIEDSFKFAGIGFWVLYFGRTVAGLVEQGIGGARGVRAGTPPGGRPA